MSKAYRKEAVVWCQGLDDFRHLTYFLADLRMKGEKQKKESGERKEDLPPPQSQFKAGMCLIYSRLF